MLTEDIQIGQERGTNMTPPHPKTIVIKKTDIQGNTKHSTEFEHKYFLN